MTSLLERRSVLTLSMDEGPKLSLAEWAALCLICERHKAAVYRAVDRLESFGLISTAGEERSARGPVRSRIQSTPAGQRAASWSVSECRPANFA
jgi:hypothetical protein